MVVSHIERGSVRQGADVPIAAGDENVQYKSVGLNVDARPWTLEASRSSDPSGDRTFSISVTAKIVR
jgi:hypothetical protein